MGVSTNAEINYGIVFDEGFEFPWDDDKYDCDIWEWWRDVNGYKPLFKPYSDDGGYAPGFSKDDPRIDEYYEHMNKWDEENPIGVKLVNYCSDDCPIYMLAIEKAGILAHRGEPALFVPSELLGAKAMSAWLTEFCAKWGIETEQEPGWYLTSYWG